MLTQTRTRRTSWFTDATWKQYWIVTRIIGLRVELSAVHLKSGRRYVARAASLDAAAANLIVLIDRYPPEKFDVADDSASLWLRVVKALKLSSLLRIPTA